MNNGYRRKRNVDISTHQRSLVYQGVSDFMNNNRKVSFCTGGGHFRQFIRLNYILWPYRSEVKHNKYTIGKPLLIIR